MTTKIKLCKDCKYFLTKASNIETCKAVIKGIDYEYERNIYFYAFAQRYPYGSCKPEALLFEPKLSLWNKLKNIFYKPQ